MSNQIVISSGAKVRNLSGVLTGTSGIVNSLGINVPDGIPQLDGSGKILVSQLPNSVMEYKGTWNAATNTPTLANGTGNAGDVYLCNVAGTTDFGAGPITFAVGDQVLYSGTTWEKASGATGTVTSVAVTESGDALTITGSPITTSGTINIGFAGTGSQYIKGDGTLATFPTTIDQAKRLITEVYNSTGATLTKGTIVYINGGQGNLPTVTKAIATGDSTSAQTYGVVQSDITNMNNGFVVVLGSLTDLDTQAYSVGTQLYLSGTTAGAWTSTKPSAPIHLVYVGIVVRSHPTQGVVEVKIQNGYELDELHDVAISSVANNDGIFYNSSTDLWENKTIDEALGYTPANASLVVPYTGATTNVNIGNNLFSSANIRVDGDNTSNFGYLGFKQFSGGSNGFNGYTSIFAQSTNYLGFSYSQGAGSFKSALFASDLISINTTRTYNLPNTNGTLALTSDLTNYVTIGTTQTITGDKTYSGVNIYNDYQTRFSMGIAINNTTSGGAVGSHTVIGANVNGLQINLAGGGYNNLNFSSTSVGNTYTLPNATGTIALTSDLGSYLPLSGGTLTGALSGTSATFSGTINANSANSQLRIGGATTDAFIGVSTSTLYLTDWATASKGLTINLTSGAATFSSSVSATQFNSNIVSITGSSANSYGPFRIDNTSQTALYMTLGVMGVTGYGIPGWSSSTVLEAVSTGDATGTKGLVLSAYSGPVIIQTDGRGERMRLTSGAAIFAGTIQAVCSTGGQNGLEIQNTSNNTSANAVIFKGWNGSTTGSIQTYVNVTTYNTSSDYRLKEDLKEFSGLDLVSSLKMYDFKWKEGGWRMYGGLAHEIQKVIPYAATGHKDEIDKDGEIISQGVDYSTLVPILVKSIQELKAEIDELKNK